MRATRLLGRPDEYFNPEFAAKAYPNARGSIALLCEVAAAEGRTDNGVLSFKILPEHFDTIQAALRLSEWFPEPRWVRIKRRDLLAQAISLAIADQTQSWDSRFKPKRAPVFSVDAIQRALRIVVNDEARWDVFFARNGFNPLTVAYEDLESDPQAIIQAIAELLDVDQKLSVDLESVPLSRQRTETNEEWRVLYLRQARDIDCIDTLNA
jgi:LPS sulfotransferase NodH